MKPGDLVRWKAEYIDEEDRDFYREKVGLVISPYKDLPGLFNVMLGGMLVGGFDYEMEVVDETG